MTSYKGEAGQVLHTNATGSTISSDEVVGLVTGTSGVIGVAIADIANGATGNLLVEGRVQKTKASGQAWTAYQVLYWDSGSSRLTTTSSSTFTRAGRAYKARASGDTTGEVLLNA